MADNLRKQARDHVVGVLLGNTAAGGRVTTRRKRAQDPDKMPAISVMTGDGVSDVLAMGNPPSLSHDVEVVVQCFAVGADVDDLLDALAVEVHAQVMANPPPFAVSFDLQNTNVVVDTSTDRTGGSAALVYSLVYHTPGDDLTRS